MDLSFQLYTNYYSIPNTVCCDFIYLVFDIIPRLVSRHVSVPFLILPSLFLLRLVSRSLIPLFVVFVCADDATGCTLYSFDEK